MSYFSNSAWAYIEKNIQKVREEGVKTNCLIFVVLSMPEKVMLELAEHFSNRCIADPTINFNLKIAQIVTSTWSTSSIDKAKRHNWLDDRGNLTYYRNLPNVQGKTNLIILCGADRVTDAGGLSDFNWCDVDVVWQTEMLGSFRSWIEAKLNGAGIDMPADKELGRKFDRLLLPLLESGRADLLLIAEWLEEMDLSSAADTADVLKLMLGEYGFFGLPKFTGFQLGKKGKTLLPYIEKANAFSTYTLFLDDKEKDKAIKTIDKILGALLANEDTGLPLDNVDVCGPYLNGGDFLKGLKNYILTENPEDRDKLKECDFVTLIDKVLKFNKKEEQKEKKETLRKISGSPVEMVLHAVWRSFREFSRDKLLIDAKVSKIKITAYRFKHDYENVDDSSTFDRTELARQHLLRLVGGVDDFVAQHLTLPMAGGDSIPVECKLADDTVSCVYGKTSEPQLEFSVNLHFAADGAEPYKCKFAWRLPEIQPYRIAEALLQWAKDGIQAELVTWKLPVFHMPYYEELMRASDDEETRRIMLHCIRDSQPDDKRLTNLLGPDWIKTSDVLLPSLKKLAEKYWLFINAANAHGLHASLRSDEWIQLRRAYEDACQFVIGEASGPESQMAAMLMRVFLITQAHTSEAGHAWTTLPFEQSGVATVLHPAVLEMLEAQILFLFSCFNAAATVELKRDDKRKAFADNIWTGFTDLASIQSPIAGLLYNEEQNINANVRGQELIHRVGSPDEREATLSTRLLLRYENVGDDEEIADTEMFRESRESKLLFNLMMDYFRLHPHARDGLNLAIFRNQDIQPIIAAVDRYLNKLSDKKDPRYFVLPDERSKPYAITVTIFTESGDDVDVSRWITQWRERWEAAETEDKFKAYRLCRFSIAHRIIELKNTDSFQSFQRLIKTSFEADISVLYNFISAGKGGNSFSEVAPFDSTTRTLKFPILEKSCCAVQHPTDSFKRSRVISNRQFVLGTLHTQIMHRLKNQGVQTGKQFVILGSGDFAPWRNVIEALHSKSEWVICIDPNMDERLVRPRIGDAQKEREIIGFGSGVGSHGEANYTISTEQFSLTDVQVLLAASIQEAYAAAGWTEDDCQAVAQSVLKEARALSGLSLVRATCVGHYIRDFMAYSLTRKLLREKREVLCDQLVSLDAYRHWFDLADNASRPDLMWLTAWIDEENQVCLNLRLIECKMAKESEEHLFKARAQINNGLRILVPAFTPKSTTEGEDNRPDQRYWWLQLHRLITSRTEIAHNDLKSVLSALELLAEGEYKITWGAAVFAFWTDSKADGVARVGEWKANEAQDITANIYTMGSEFVRKLALDGSAYPVTWDEWAEQAHKEAGNICLGFEDIEMPPGEDEDEDTPGWGDQEEDAKPDTGHEDESDAPAASGTTQENTPETKLPEPAVEPTPPVPTNSITPLNTIAAPTVPTVATPSIPDRILLGKTIGGAKPIYWEFGNAALANRHMIVFGTSGFGKTYAIQCILSELGRSGQNSLVVDYTDGFIPSKLEAATAACLKPKQHFIEQEPLPIRPFKAQVSYESGMEFKDKPISIAKRVAAIFKSVYELGNQQFPVLIDAITEGVEKFGDGFTLRKLLDILTKYIDDGEHGAGTVRTTISKLKPFINAEPFASDKTEFGWRELFSDPASRCHVFQFFKVDKHSARALIEFVLWDFYAFASSFGNKDTPRVVVLDEIQNLDLGPDSPVAKYLTEGRKHGISLITATQTVKGVGGVSDARVSRLFQAEHKLFFRPTENEMREHAQLLHNAISNVSAQDWATRLASLQRGECWSLGRTLNETTGALTSQAQRIKISSLEERGFNA